MLFFSVYGCMLCLVRYLFVINTSVIDCLGRFVPEMTYYVSSGTLNLAQLNSAPFLAVALYIFVNVLAYADDMVLLAPCWKALQQLLTVFAQHIANIDMICNVKKTVCMIFEPRDRSKIMSVAFRNLVLMVIC